MLNLDTIEKSIDRGGIFFVSDFSAPSNYEAVRKSLQRLTKDGKITRIAKGIYLLPKTHARLGVIFPHAEEIAKAIAKRDKARILPTGSTALNILGLSTQVPMKVVFLTDGSARSIKVGKQTIQFKKTNPKNLSTEHRLTSIIIQALKTIGEKNVRAEQVDRIQMIIDESGEQELIYQNLKGAPIWVQKVILANE